MPFDEIKIKQIDLYITMKKQIKSVVRVKSITQLSPFFKRVTLLTITATIALTSCNKNEDDLIDHSQPTKSTTSSNSQNKSITNSGSSSSKFDEDKLVFVEGGSFMMGSPANSGEGDERPQHKVTLNSYKISKFEITNEQFAKFLTAKGNQKSDGGLWYQGSDFNQKGTVFTAKKGSEKLPVRFVTWSGANAYAQWVGGRIPTEAEWEFAARGGNKSKGYTYSGSNNINDVGWYVGNSGQRLHTVGEKKPNELGIYDMSGNVWEWTADWYGAYTKEDKNNPKGASSGNARVRRGASAFCALPNTRSANRSSRVPDGVRHNLGFRVVFDVK